MSGLSQNRVSHRRVLRKKLAMISRSCVIPCIVLVLGAIPVGIQAATHTVTSAADSGPGSLRAAITAANATPEIDDIVFSIGVGPVSIVLASPLPPIQRPLRILGLTQPPAGNTTPLVRLAGQALPEHSIGLQLQAAGCTPDTCLLQGIQIVDFPGDGVVVSEGSWRIRSTYIGTDGNIARPNGGHGLVLASNTNWIGGDLPVDRNVISGNAGDGIVVSGLGNIVHGNRIGTTASGTAALPNAGNGVRVVGANTRIGGEMSDTGNLISGNAHDGIAIEAGAHGTLLRHNRIGTNANGNALLGNAHNGVIIRASGVTIGLPGQGNLISGNGHNGILIASEADDSRIQANLIGTTAAGTAALPNARNGIQVLGTHAQIGGSTQDTGNLISGNALDGVAIEGSANHSLLRHNRIGTNAAGNAPVGNAHAGIVVRGPNSAIGVPGHGNLISGNGDNGIAIYGMVEGSTFQGNRIGTNAAGTTALGNTNYGIRAIAGEGVGIGGGNPGAGNLISGNGRGVAIEAGMVGTTVQGNVIGLDATQSTRLGNGSWSGLDVSGSDTLIGGSMPGEGNVIAGNSGSGIVLYGAFYGPSAFSTRVFGNHVGTNANGSSGLGNSQAGIQVYLAHGMQIGGVLPGEGNHIAHNGLYGVYVRWGDHNSIIGNRIHDNQSLDIEIGQAGVIENDALDADTGPNFGQNFPVIRSALHDAGSVRIEGQLHSVPLREYLIEIVHSPHCLASGLGQATTSLGFVASTTNAAGDATFLVDLPLETAGGVVAAIATAQDGSGSEISPCHALAGPNPGSFHLSRDPYLAWEGNPDLEVSIVRAMGSHGAVSVQFDTLPGTATAPEDYIGVSERITFADGETMKTVRIPIIADPTPEAQEYFRLRISDPHGGATLGSQSEVEAIVIDVGPAFPTYAIDHQDVEKPAEGTRPMQFTVRLTATAVPMTIHYQTTDSTARAGLDYQATSGELHFPASDQVQTQNLIVQVLANEEDEGDRTFYVDIWPGGSAGAWNSYGMGVIRQRHSEHDDALFSDGFEG